RKLGSKGVKVTFYPSPTAGQADWIVEKQQPRSTWLNCTRYTAPNLAIWEF
ncbi:hypothetical protein J6590_066367, partial [Homalodisca vitripennis]